MKKAVSPVIATLLLILIAVAAAVLVYVWVTGYASSVTSTGTPELHEEIKIDAVSYSDTTLTVYVRNIGDTGAFVDYIYVIATNNTVITATSVSLSLSPGTVTSATVNNVDLEPGVTYIVKAVTSNGIEAATSFSYSS